MKSRTHLQSFCSAAVQELLVPHTRARADFDGEDMIKYLFFKWGKPRPTE